jgi:hypothetical protein
MKLVASVPEDGKRINIEGRKGESLLYHPVIWVIEQDFNRIKEQNERHNEFMRRAKEERLLALVGALLVEEALDLLIGAYIPDYSRLKVSGKFTLFLKTELARSLRIIPQHIIESVALINTVRNKFAHELTLESFDRLDVGTKNSLKDGCEVFYPGDEFSGKTVGEQFKGVVFCVIIALAVYAPHLRAAREYIFSEAFVRELDRLMKEKQT